MKRNKFIILLLIFSLSITLAVAGCAREEEPDEDMDQGADEGDVDEGKLAEKQVLRVNLGEEPPCLDPQISTDTTSSEILNDTLEGIIRLDQEGTVKKGSGMAENWEISEDGKVYTFELRDAVWSDGTPVTAKDFEYAWKRVLDPEVASDYSFMAYDILNAEEYNKGEITDPNKVGVKAIDNNTLEVKLKAANPIFVSKLQHSTFFPSRKDMIEEHGGKYASEADLVPSCGPFKVTEWQHESKVVLEKNSNYWDADAVKIDRIDFMIVKNSNSTMGMYETGQIDYALVPSQFLDKYKDKLIRMNRASTGYRLFNTEDKYMKNQKLRIALRKALDMKKIYETLANGTVDAAYAWVPPGIPGYEGKTFREIAGDKLYNDIGTGSSKEEIQQMIQEGLDELGISLDDLQNEISYLTGDSDTSLKYAEVYQQMWEENAGITTGIEQATWKVRLDRMDSGDFVLTGLGWVGDYNDAMTFMDLFLSDNPQNRSRWGNEEYDSYIKQAQVTYDQKERVDSMVAAEKILMDEMPIAPASYGTDIYVQKPYVKNIVRLPLLVSNGKKWAYMLEH